MNRKPIENPNAEINPALTHIIDQPEQQPDVPMKLNPLYIETKSKRTQILIQPSLHKRAKQAAAKSKISVNELFNRALEEYLK